jgi:hypothetical protein
VRSTSTSSRERWRAGAFTIIELMVGISIAACLALAIAPVWNSWEKRGDGEADQSIWFIQSRVAMARFERDLRQGGAAHCPFVTGGPVLEATDSQVVVLEHGEGDAPPFVIEWEIARGSLMRRWRPCPLIKPASWPHSSYVDSKTMLEGVQAESSFAYYAGAKRLSAPVDEAHLALVTTVRLEVAGGALGAAAEVHVSTTGRVGW